MKIVGVLHYPMYGGPHNRFALLAERMRADGDEVLVVLPRDAGNAVERFRAAGVRVATLPLGRARATRKALRFPLLAMRYPIDVLLLMLLLRREGAHLVVLTSSVNFQAGLAARLLGIPVVWQIVDSGTPRPLIRPAMAMIERLSAVIMFWGHAIRRLHVGERDLGVPTFYGHSAVDLTRHRPDQHVRAETRDELGISDDRLLVGLLANFNRQKGIDTFVEAVGLLAGTHPDAEFVHVGALDEIHRDYADEVHRRVRELGIGHRLRFLGGTSDPHRFYAAFDVQVVSSVRDGEGIPTVILEGMATGLPIVATRSGSTDEMVIDGETGFVVEPSDPAALAARIAQLLTDEAMRAAMGARALVRAQRDFGIDAVLGLHREAFAAAMQSAPLARR